MKKLIVLLVIALSFQAIANDECQFRAGVLQLSLDLIKGGFTQSDAKQQIMYQIRDQPVDKERTGRWVDLLLASVYRDPNAPFSDSEYNYQVFYRYCSTHFEQYGGKNSLVNFASK
jgi:hypothetical protein